MSNHTRKQSILGAAVLFLIVVLGSIAWACTYQPKIEMLPPAGLAGSQSKAKGSGFFPPGSVVEIRWNSPSGEVLGSGVVNENLQFAINVIIPDVPAGVYYVAASINGTVHATNSFEVTSPTANSANENNPVTVTSGGQVTNSTTVSDPQAVAEEGSTSGTTVGGFEPSRGSSVEENITSGAVTSGSPVPAPASSATSGSSVNSASSSSTPASANSASVQLDGRAVFGGSLAPSVPQKSASGDLWSGFKREGRGASLVPGLETSAQTSGEGKYAMLAWGALGAAGVGMFAGFASAETARRRRATS